MNLDPFDLNGPSRITIALLFPLIAFVLQWFFWDAIQPYVWFLFYPAVFFSSWIGGKKGGILATFFSTVVVWWFFIPNRYSFVLERPTSLCAIGIFAVMGVLFSLTHERLRKAKQLAAEALVAVSAAKAQLEERVSERTSELAQTIAELHASEEALRKTEYLMSEGQRIAHLGSFEYDAGTQHTTWSEEEYRIYGLDPGCPSPEYKEMLTTCIHPDDRDTLHQVFFSAMQSVSAYELEHRIVRPDGSIRWVYDRAYPYFDVTGTLIRYIGTTLDITERKLAETALRESNSLLRVAGRMAGFGGWNVNLEDGKVTWSDEVALIHDEQPGFSPAVTDGINYYAPEWREKITTVFSDCVRDGTPYDEEMQIITARGRRVWVRTIGEAVRDLAGIIVQVHGAFQDITERKQAETAVKDSETHFRTLANSIPNLAWWADGNGYFTWYNQRWYEYTGTTPEQMEGWGWQRVHDPKVLPQVMERWKASIATGEPFEMEFPLRGADGEFHTFLTRVLPVKDLDGRVIRWFGTNTDISELKKTQETIVRINEELEERVRERTAQLETVNKELETFSYSVSHDLKAPLRGIDGYSQLLAKEYADRLDDEGRLFIHNIRDSAGQMHQLIEDLLRYSRMERRSMQNIRLDLGELVKMVVAERAAEIKQAGVQLRLEVMSITLHADRDGLAIVLRNLLENALKFSGKALPPTVDIGARHEEGKVILWVRDNGIGFDMKFHDRIFEIFQRLQRSEDYPGTGIGLALVRKAMGRMGGRVWAESSPGVGATFFLEIPL